MTKLTENSYNNPSGSLINRYLAEETNDEETARVEAWIKADPKNRQIINEFAYIQHAQSTYSNIVDKDNVMPLFLIRQRIKHRSNMRMLKYVSIAASLLIGFVGLAVLFYQQGNDGDPTWVTISAKDHQRTLFSLPDGSKVHLNSGSSITYPLTYEGNERTVTLTGEAYFNVVRNEEKPFVVRTSNDRVAVRVLGTTFIVSAHDDEPSVQTTLLSGSVQLDIKGMQENVVLKPSEKAIYSIQDSELKILSVDTIGETDWLYNRLIFRETPMKEVFDRLSKFYQVDFNVSDRDLYSYKFTGSFYDKPLSQVLDYMKISSKIKYSIKHEDDINTIVRIWK